MKKKITKIKSICRRDWDDDEMRVVCAFLGRKQDGGSERYAGSEKMSKLCKLLLNMCQCK